MVDWPGPWHHGLTEHEYLALSVSMQTDENSVIAVLLYGCETDTKRQPQEVN